MGRLTAWVLSLLAAYAINLGAFAALYAIGSAAGPLLYTYPAGRAAYNAMISGMYALAFLASFLVVTHLMDGVDRVWGLRFIAAPLIPFVVLIGYLIASTGLSPMQSLWLLLAGEVYERIVIYVVAPVTASVKLLGWRLGTVKAGIAGVLAGGAAYALVTYALPPALTPLQETVSGAVWGLGSVLIGHIFPTAALAIESVPFLIFRE